MTIRKNSVTLLQSVPLAIAFLLAFLPASQAQTNSSLSRYTLDFESRPNAKLQNQIEKIVAGLRSKYEIGTNQVSVGVLDLTNLRLAMINPDRGDYAASVPKIGILLAYFQLRPEAVSNLDSETARDLGLMAKASNNETAAKFSRELGLKEIQQVLNSYNFYDEKRGGGIWVGKHYGKGDERYGDPLGDNSHAATVRQLLRFYLMLEQGKLISPEASRKMREIMESPEIPHDNIKFVKGLSGKNVQIIRKWGSWKNWLHDSAVITGPNRHYILVGMTYHAKGDDYLVELAQAVDDLMQSAVEDGN